MDVREMIERRTALKVQAAEILDKVEAEKRAMTEEEKGQLEAIDTELQTLRYRINVELSGNDPGRAKEPATAPEEFRKRVDAILDGKASNKIEVRAAGVTMSEQVKEVTPVLMQDLIDPLEKGLALSKLGNKTLTGVRGTPVWPSLASMEATLMGEGVEMQTEKLNLSTIKSQPRRGGIAVELTREAVIQSGLGLYSIVMKQLGLSLSRMLNNWAFSGTKFSQHASEGPFVKTTVPTANKIEYTTAPTFKDVVALETAVRNQNVPVADTQAGYVISSAMGGILKTTPIEAGNIRMIYEDGKINGYPVVETNYLAADAIAFGVFDYFAVLQYGDIDITVDPYTKATSGVVRFVLNSDFDEVVLLKEAFALATKKA